MNKSERTRLTRDGLWIAIGQFLALAGTLLGTRLLTEMVQPALFGELALVIAALALAQGLLYFPLGHAALRSFPECVTEAQHQQLRSILLNAFIRRYAVCAACCLLAAIVLSTFAWHPSLLVWILALLLLALDGWKTVEIVQANGLQRQVSYSALIAADGTLRPIAAAACAWIWQPTLEAVLLGQCIAILSVLVIFKGIAKPSEVSGPPLEHRELLGLSKKMHGYARPLVWSPVIGWISGVADRYIITGVLGLAAAGLYSAAYGLASRPFLMLGTITEATFRQSYYAAISATDRKKADRIFAAWMATNLITGALGVFVLWVWGGALTGLLLASNYAPAAEFLPWIGIGYAIFITAQAYERVGYAHGETAAMTKVQLCGALSAIVFGTVGAWQGGVLGVAMAVPAYFGVQLILTRVVAKRAENTSKERAQ